MSEFRLTDKDKQLLSLLQVNARESASALGRKLGVSRSTIQDRLSRLEDAGIIEGYAVRVNQARAMRSISCFAMIICDNKTYAGVMGRLRKFPQIQAVYAVNGEWDFIAHICAGTLEELNGVLTEVNMVPGVVKTNSHIVMETKVSREL